MYLIRNASSNDLDTVLALLRSADLPCEDVPPIFGDSFAVAIADESVIGVAGVERVGELGLFRSVGVGADQRGKGIGEALTRNRIEWAKSHGITELYLLTPSAADYFTRYGFEKIARTEVPATMLQTYEFKELCPDSATVMRLKLVN